MITKKTSVIILILLLSFAFCLFTFAQSSNPLKYREAGFPFIQNFSPNDYGGAHSQNWAILQDRRGIMYFGNGSGVLEYDGVSWRLIPLSNNTIVRSLAMDETGRIYVGGVGEFGYLTPDSLGLLYYASLLDKVAPENRDFNDVWQTLSTSEGIYFRTKKYLFRWTPEKFQPDEKTLTIKTGHLESRERGTLRIWNAETIFHKSFIVRDKFYVNQSGFGLMTVVNDSLQLLPGGGKYADKKIYVMLPFYESKLNHPGLETQQKMLVGTRNHGLSLYDGKSFYPFEFLSSVLAYLNENNLYYGAVLPDTTFALATSGGGVVIISRQGELLNILNKAAGLRDESVRFVYPDRQGGLWLALNNGLARVEIPAPFSFYNEQSGLQGNVDFILKHQNHLFTAGSRGVYSLLLPTTVNKLPGFINVEGITGNSWSLLSVDETLLAATEDGVYRIGQNQAIKICSFGSRTLYLSRYYRDLIFVGLDDGLAVLKKFGNEWQLAARIAGVSEEVRTIVEEAPGILWLGHLYEGFSRVKIKDESALIKASLLTDTEIPEIAANVEHYNDSSGLPGGTGRVFLINGRIVFATNEGLKSFDPVKRLFVPDSTFGSKFADTTRVISRLVEDRNGNVWIKSTVNGLRETGVAIPIDKPGSLKGMHREYTWYATPFLHIAEWGSVYDLYPDPDQPYLLWIGGSLGLIRYDGSVVKDYTIDFPALVRQVIVNGDSVIYYGASASDDDLRLEFKDNTIRFRYAAPTYDDPSRNRYRIFLEGFDKKWSKWTAETQKDYTNLPDGSYRFHVKAKNIYNVESSEGIFEFTILPPWYYSWWAYLVYVMFVIGLISFIVYNYIKWKTGKLAQRTHELETVVAERTAELAEKNVELHELNTMKSRFFANISHEFRTPLTLILGQIENVLPDLKHVRNIDRLKMAARNGKQLLRLINQLLDLSRFDASQMSLKASRQNIVPFLHQLTDSFESLARQRNISLSFDCKEDNIPVYFEQDKIEKVMHNLLSNALKFTSENGKVLVTVKPDISPSVKKGEAEQLSSEEYDTNLSGEDMLNTGDIIITVRDSGIGIPKNQLPHIFDRFYQVDSSTTREYEGTGIGLALTKELVQIHSGGISVESTEGFGTTFTVRIPLGKSHLKPEQIEELFNKSGVNTELGDEESKSEQDTDSVILESQISGSQDSNKPEIQSETSIDTQSAIVLIVEDNSDMRTYIRESIEGNYQILEAANGEEGFSIAQESIPDLIITDVMMPRMDGYELTRCIREDRATSHIPVIMLTAKAADEDKFEGLEKGVDAYVTKPFSKKELQIRVRKLIELRQQLRKSFGSKSILTPSKIEVSSMDQSFLEQVKEIIEENMGDENFNVDQLSSKIAIGQRQLQRKLKALIDSSPQQCIRIMRLQRARQLLEQGAGTVTEICYQVGYGNVNAFTRAFKEEIGFVPSDIKRK